MSHEAPDFRLLLECLADRLPKFLEALLAQPDAALERLELRSGTPLLQRGDTAQALYVVVTGLLRATARREDGSELTLSVFGRGEMAGEIAILTGGGAYSAPLQWTWLMRCTLAGSLDKTLLPP